MMTTDPYAVWISKTLRRDCSGALRRDDARNLMRRTLESAIVRYDVRLHAWAIMPSRVELVVALPTAAPLQQIIGDAFCYFTRRFNSRYRHKGPIFRSKFIKRVLASPESVRRAIDDVNRMPLKAELVRKPGAEAFGSADFYREGSPDTLVTPFPGMELITPGPTWIQGI
jgi:REP element-mobilizing transposase RayT